METKIMTLSGVKKDTEVFCVSDINISESYINSVIESNKDYFDLIRSRKIGVKVLKFENSDSLIVMRTFSEKGFEAATYKVLNDHKLFLDKETLTSSELYRKNGLHVVEYDYMAGDEDEMIYRMLDDDELDPVGDGFTLEEAILFAENYHLAHDLEYN